jgi:hypothetical protein
MLGSHTAASLQERVAIPWKLHRTRHEPSFDGSSERTDTVSPVPSSSRMIVSIWADVLRSARLTKTNSVTINAQARIGTAPMIGVSCQVAGAADRLGTPTIDAPTDKVARAEYRLATLDNIGMSVTSSL